MLDLSELPVVQPSRRPARDKDGLHKRRGYWYYSLRVKGRRRFFSTKTKSYQEARGVYQQAVEEHKKGRLPSDNSKRPFDQVARDWLLAREAAVAKGEIAANTFRIDSERIRPLLRAFAGLRACDISAEHLERYQAERAKRVANKTINLETAVLRMILKGEKVWDRVSAGFKTLTTKKRGPGRALTLEEERKLFDMASSNPLWVSAYLGGLVAANTTARGCELKRLKLADVDLATGEFRIWRKTTKTDAGERTIPMNGVARWAFARLVERAQDLGAAQPAHFLFPAFLSKRTQHSADDHLVGYDPTQNQKTWRTAWRSLTRAAGLKGLRFHDLRHHSITRLAEAGVPDQTIMAIAGHVAPDMLNYYSQIRKRARQAAVSLIESYSPNQTPTERKHIN